MAIPSRQIGWGQEEILLNQISKQLEYLTRVVYNIPNNTTTTSTTTSTTTTTTTINPSNLSLTVSNTGTDFDIAENSDFTIEWNMYLAADDNHPRAYSFGSYFTGGASHAVSIEGGTFYWWVDGNIILSPSVSLTGGWHHVCIERASGVAQIFIDGVSIANTAFTLAIPSASKPLYIGSEGDDSLSNGLFSNFRWNSTTAVYDPLGFTPPTQPLTSVGGTTLLLLQGNSLPLELTDNSGLSQTINNGSGSYNSSNPFGGYEGCIQFGTL